LAGPRADLHRAQPDFEGVGRIRPLEADDEITLTERAGAIFRFQVWVGKQRLPQPPGIDGFTRRRDDGKFRLTPDRARRRRRDGKAGGEAIGQFSKDGCKLWGGAGGRLGHGDFLPTGYDIRCTM
jgi:hypothetical protein